MIRTVTCIITRDGKGQGLRGCGVCATLKSLFAQLSSVDCRLVGPCNPITSILDRLLLRTNHVRRKRSKAELPFRSKESVERSNEKEGMRETNRQTERVRERER